MYPDTTSVLAEGRNASDERVRREKVMKEKEEKEKPRMRFG